MGTTPMFSPSGVLGDIPNDRIQDAVKSGFQLGHEMNAPDGSEGVIPHDKVHDAIKAGFSPYVPTETQQAAKPTVAQINTPMDTSLAPKIVRGATGSLPAVGGITGGLLAGTGGLPSGPGAIATGAAGAGLGTAAGEQARLIANHILFGNSEPLPQSKEGLKSTAIQGGIAAGTSGLLGTAGYLATRTPTPQYSQSESDWREVNDALGVKPKMIRIPKGAEDISEAYNMPGRSVAEKTGITADQFNKMTPFEQAAKIAPAWKQAGQDVTAIADAATQQGVAFDINTPVTKAIQNLPTPQMQERAFNIVNDTADELGLKNWKAASPNEVLALRRALWDGLPPGFRAPLYGSITGSLKANVPEIVPADQTYSELSAAIEATKTASQKFAVTVPPPSNFVKTVKAVAPYAVAGAVGAGGAKAVHLLSDLMNYGH